MLAQIVVGALGNDEVTVRFATLPMIGKPPVRTGAGPPQPPPSVSTAA